ncbi:MAG: hypothetical protein HY985_12005 [Magnetospirillum sp.]|nr:hypothetical protein [Magnetospirillum sp.]
MRQRIKSALKFTFAPKARAEKFHTGMFVRYTGRHLSADAQRHMKGARLVRGGIYTVARTLDDGTSLWLFVQELPGVRLHAEAFVPTPHLAEDHWELGSFHHHAAVAEGERA